MAAKKSRSRSRAGARPRAAAASRPRPPKAPEALEDFVDIVAALNAVGARFLVVGAYAMAAHGVPRATGDFDVWVEPGPENGPRVYEALTRFGAPLQALGITLRDLLAPGVVCQIGLPPRRIDVTTVIDGVEFAEAWKGRLEGSLGSERVSYLGREALLRNKQAAGRAKDLADIAALRRRDDEPRRRRPR